jgi:uncharacterized protein YdhG (YjbR/CyaY superfamily)
MLASDLIVIDDYLAKLDPTTRRTLQSVREAIRAAAPEAEEGSTYGMPGFRLGGRPLAGFKASKDHCSFHPMSSDVMEACADALKGYDTAKGTVRFPKDAPLPKSLVRKLVRARIAELER